jgi:hypothetical protein
MEQDGLHATVNEKNGTGDNWYQTVQEKVAGGTCYINIHQHRKIIIIMNLSFVPCHQATNSKLYITACIRLLLS